MTSLLIIAFATPLNDALDNGLARTPPMGWQAWERFRCQKDCDLDPQNCLSENLIRAMADKIVELGFKDLGYEYINIDDCWMAPERDNQSRLMADPKRFPSGIKSLADYIHAKGLKIGIYESMGMETCQGLPGTFPHIELDAQTFAEWGIDFVKMDTCHTPAAKLVSQGFMNFSLALNSTGRPMVFSCEWPHVIAKCKLVASGPQASMTRDVTLKEIIEPNWAEMFHFCNTIRNLWDIQDSWKIVVSIVDGMATKQDVLHNVSGPGKFNDPDMIIVGDYSLSYDQSKSQLALWAIMAAQWLMSNDLRTLAPWALELLQNKEVIAVDQDPLGIMGKRIIQEKTFEVWTRLLANDSYAAVFFSRATDLPHRYSYTPAKLGFNSARYAIRDLFDFKDMGVFGMQDPINVSVNPSGVVMIKATPVPHEDNSVLQEY